jgi:hypothetical protein
MDFHHSTPLTFLSVNNNVLITLYPHNLLELARVFLCLMCGFSAFLSILERVLAALMLETYERRKNSMLILSLHVGVMPTAGAMAYFGEWGFLVFGDFVRGILEQGVHFRLI